MADRIAPGSSLEVGQIQASGQLLAEANRARHRRQDRRAIALYRRILLEDPRHLEAALRVAPLLASQGEAFAAWQLYRMAAAELHRARRVDACLAVLRDACRCVPHEYDVWRLRAELEQKLGREEDAYDTLLEGAQHFDRPHTAMQAIALLTRARAIEPRDPEVALDLARLYVRTGLIESALTLLAALAPCVQGRVLRRVRGLQWRVTLSFYHAWRWLAASWREARGERDASAGVLAAAAPASVRVAHREAVPEPYLPFDA
ncbi:MAG: tetratricopeptide repeat protein [Myxococcales bacterium]|nr:MAG: tetratricopeptide repeat protein [Myxococcales bacterium]